MNILKSLFGGGSAEDRDARGSYFYVKPQRCDDILKVRVDMANDLSLADDGKSYWVRKLASSGNYKCNQVELTLYFNNNRQLQDSEVQGGTLVDRKAYDAWVATQAEQEA